MVRLPASRKIVLTSRKVAKIIANFAADKKAENILVLDVRRVVNFCDYSIICSATSARHVQAIADGIIDGLEEQDMKVKWHAGTKNSPWALIDLGDLVIHVFEEKVREFYNLEYLWQDAKKITWK